MTRELELSPQYFLISISTLLLASSQACLRANSGGARYRQVRVAFYAYSQVSRADRLTTVQASIVRKNDFTLPRNRSPGFGSYRSDLGVCHLQPNSYEMRCFAFATASPLKGLALPLQQTPSLVIQDERHNTDPGLWVTKFLKLPSKPFVSFMLCLPITV